MCIIFLLFFLHLLVIWACIILHMLLARFYVLSFLIRWNNQLTFWIQHCRYYNELKWYTLIFRGFVVDAAGHFCGFEFVLECALQVTTLINYVIVLRINSLVAKKCWNANNFKAHSKDQLMFCPFKRTKISNNVERKKAFFTKGNGRITFRAHFIQNVMRFIYKWK